MITLRRWFVCRGMVIALFGAAQVAVAQQVPTVKQWLSLRTAGAPVVSPDGAAIAYTVTGTDWDATTRPGPCEARTSTSTGGKVASAG